MCTYIVHVCMKHISSVYVCCTRVYETRLAGVFVSYICVQKTPRVNACFMSSAGDRELDPAAQHLRQHPGQAAGQSGRLKHGLELAGGRRPDVGPQLLAVAGCVSDRCACVYYCWLCAGFPSRARLT